MPYHTDSISGRHRDLIQSYVDAHFQQQLDTPLAENLMTQLNVALMESFLDIAVTEGKRW